MQRSLSGKTVKLRCPLPIERRGARARAIMTQRVKNKVRQKALLAAREWRRQRRAHCAARVTRRCATAIARAASPPSSLAFALATDVARRAQCDSSLYKARAYLRAKFIAAIGSQQSSGCGRRNKLKLMRGEKKRRLEVARLRRSARSWASAERDQIAGAGGRRRRRPMLPLIAAVYKRFLLFLRASTHYRCSRLRQFAYIE